MMSSTLLPSCSSEVIPNDEPTVAKADTHSKTMAFKGRSGSVSVTRKMKNASTITLVKTAALALRMESVDSSRPANSTRLDPWMIARMFR